MSELERALDELDDVQRRLDALAEDDVSARLDLHERRARLREQISHLRQQEGGQDSVEALRKRLASLEARRDELLSRRVTQDPHSGFGRDDAEPGEEPATGGSGTDRIHLPHTDQWALEDRRLEERIAELRRQLVEMGEDDTRLDARFEAVRDEEE